MKWQQYSRREFMLAGMASAAFLCSNRALAKPTDPYKMDIAQASQLVRAGELSPTELAESYFARIAKFDPRLNAFITVTERAALMQARVLESELAKGIWRGPLHGIPIALKDNIDTAGIRTTAASAVYEDRVPGEDAEVVRRLKNAGAIILGKLNMQEFALGETLTTSRFGRVRNPWDLTRIPGGSSSGPGAAVAARLCAAALGTDTGGSIRIPAALCGVVGLMPTYGLASVRGIIPFSFTLDHVGPMCRTVGDAALILQAIAGYDPQDIASIEVEIPEYRSAFEREVAGLRLGIPRAMYSKDIDPEILGAVEEAIGLLSSLTAGTVEVQLPPLPGLLVGRVEIYEYHEDLIKEKRELYGPLTLQLILAGAEISATDYVAELQQVKRVRRAIIQVFDHVDLLVTPTVLRLPVTIDEAQTSPQQRALIPNTIPFNYFGIPALTIPCGFSRSGLPIGVQLCGPALGELDLLALAHAYQLRTDWHLRSPPLA
jgi:aspartyl-tRNA(Asn)/glutamyl-tRNA(Gln) amidotransferase subunit A